MTSDAAELSWRQDAALAALNLDGVDLLSVDVFDTLLLRRCGPPEGVFALLARAARAHGLIEPWITDDAFVIMRRAAEAQARRDLARSGRGGDVTLADIHRHLALGPAGLADLECAVERDVAVANPFVADLLRHARQRGIAVALLSDMYLPTPVVAGLLAAAGIGGVYDRLYVSAEAGAVKAGGGLFHRLLADHPGLAAGRVLHLGDNPVSDVAGAAAAGIRAVDYAPPQHVVALEAREGRLGLADDGTLSLLRRLAGRSGKGGEDRFWFDLGALILGPVAVHYARWVVRDAAARGIRRIAPLMREGALLGTLMADDAAALGMTVRPLHVSRGALLLPSLDDVDADALEAIAGDSVFRTVGDLARLFGVGPLPPMLADAAGIPLVDLLGDDGGPYAALRDWLLEPPRRAILRERVREARRDLLDYLSDELGDAAPVAFVDIGARGTLIRRLCALAEVRERHAPHGYLFYATTDALRQRAAGLPLTVAMPLDAAAIERARIVYRSPQILELMLNGDAETTIGYRRDGRVRPVTQPAVLPAGQRAALRACHAGIRHYAAIATRLSGNGPDVATGATLDRLYRLVQAPTAQEAARLGELVYDINDATDAARTLCGPDARRAVADLTAAVRPTLWLNFALQRRPSEIPWPQGALSLEQPGWIEDLFDAVHGGFGHRAICRHLVDMARADGATRLIVCAAGGSAGMGPAFAEVAREAGLEVTGYADLLVPEAGGAFAGAPGLALTEAGRQECRHVAVVSTGYGTTILAALRDAAQADGRPLICYWFDGTAFRRTLER